MQKFVNILFTLFFIVYGIAVTIFSFSFFLIWGLFKLIRLKKVSDFLGFAFAKLASALYLGGAFVSVKVKGKENLKDHPKNLCIVANHQSLVDIPLLVYSLPCLVGFIAKKELFKVPVLQVWLMILRCVPMNRKSPRDSVEAIQAGIEQIAAGYPMIIFPEGTRSRSNKQREFKPGSFKLAYKANATIIPVTIDGAFHIYEEHKLVSPFKKVVITIHPLVDTSNMSEEEQIKLPAILCNQINSAKRVVEPLMIE